MNFIISKFTTSIQSLWTKVTDNWQVERTKEQLISRIYKATRKRQLNTGNRQEIYN